MTSLLGPMLVAVLAAAQTPAQAPTDRTFSGEVVDGDGKPVADARVIFYVPASASRRTTPVQAQATTDQAGRFSMVGPRVETQRLIGGNFLAFSPGQAIGAVSFLEQPRRVVLRMPRTRTIKIEGPDGQPVAGARVAIRLLSVFRSTIAEVPPSLADSLAVSTGPAGITTLDYLAERDQLVAIRITADSIGSQDFLLVEHPSRASEPTVITVKLQSTGSISGRLVDSIAQPVAGQVVEVWTREASTVVESITDPATRSWALVHLSDQLPDSAPIASSRCSTEPCSKPESRATRAID